jgi:REP element-mobilizing transposase RayT
LHTFGSANVRLEDVLKTIADQCGCWLLAARVHDGDHAHVFVFAPPKVSIPVVVRVFKCISAKVLFVEFPIIKKQLWVGICGQRVMLLGLRAMLLMLRLKNTSTENRPD